VAQHCNSHARFSIQKRSSLPLLAPALALPSSLAVYSAYSEYGEHLFPETRHGRPELGRRGGDEGESIARPRRCTTTVGG